MLDEGSKAAVTQEIRTPAGRILLVDERSDLGEPRSVRLAADR